MSQIMELNLNCDQEKSQLENRNITYNDVASKLIRDKYILTALELHTELLESGKELRQLKDFFSNPGNFEVQTVESTSYLSRSGSQGTLDSLDLARYSEDGAGIDERVAVLEFELRKAKETINALRNNLTVATESDTTSPAKGQSQNVSVGSIKPHEQRALNFLVNEYLLIHGYKLTSITFADENQSQDFDDWDDVGLNISKPPELLTLYRDGLKHTALHMCIGSTQTEYVEIEEVENEGRIIQLMKQIETLTEKTVHLENENSNLKMDNSKIKQEFPQILNPFKQTDESSVNTKNNIRIEKNMIGSDSPETFEMIDKNMSVFRQSIATSDDSISNSSFNANEWINLNIPQNTPRDQVSSKRNLKNSTNQFLREVMNMCYVNVPYYVEMEEVLNQEIAIEDYVQLVSESLLKIIPNVILNKREEVIPLMISTIHLNPKSSERDKLLQQLFNLKKKPSESERRLILGGLIGIAKCSGESMVENEILPQCWLQLTHKLIERRLLVAEACIALIPYVSNSIRNSLCLSMLQQMLEDKDEVVRESVIKALALLSSFCDDSDKYGPCEQLAINCLNDSSEGVINLTSQILFPVLSKWALEKGVLTSSLYDKLLNKLNTYLKNIDSPNKPNQAEDKIVKIVNVIANLLPFLFIYVAGHKNIISNIEKNMAMDIGSDFKNICTTLTSPEIFYDGDVNCGMILYEFEQYIQHNPEVSWPEMDWILDVMLPDLFSNLQLIEINRRSLLQSFMNLFSHICIVFGKSFSKYKIRPLLHTKIQNLEQVISNLNQYCHSLNIIPVYLTILSYSNDYEDLSSVLKKFLFALPLCGTPLDCLEITVNKLCEAGLQELVADCLWAGVVHQRQLVRAASASLFSVIVELCSHDLLKTKVTGALVTLASDSDIIVKTATVPALCSLIINCSLGKIHEKVYMQLQSYLSDSNLRDNHMLLRQIIVSLGNIVNSCSAKFQNDVILPQITSLTQFVSQMKNQTRKVDLVQALLESYTNIIYAPFSKHSISSSVLPGLRLMENMVLENQSLNIHWETVSLMIKECENKIETTIPQSPVELNAKLCQNVNQGVEEVKQRVSKLFTKPVGIRQTTLPNIQGIFKKK